MNNIKEAARLLLHLLESERLNSDAVERLEIVDNELLINYTAEAGLPEKMELQEYEGQSHIFETKKYDVPVYVTLV